MSEHYIEKCKACGDVIGQCRCPAVDKTVRWALCEACYAKVASAHQEIRYLGDMQRLEMKPGDVLVFKTKRLLEDAAVDRIRQNVEQHLPGVKVLIIGPDIELGIIGGATEKKGRPPIPDASEDPGYPVKS